MSLRRLPFRYVLIVCAFLGGMLAGVYAGAVIENGHAQQASPEVAYALNHAADLHGTSRACLWNIAWRESRYRPWENNWQGSGAAGLMQFKAGTYSWMAGMAGYPTDPGWRYDAWVSAHVASWAIAHGYLSHWGWC